MKTVTIDLEQLSDAVNKDVLKESKYNALKQDLDGKYNVLINKIPDIATLIANTVLNTKIAEGQKKKKKKKKTGTSRLFTNSSFNTNVGEVQKKMSDVIG